MSDSIPQDSPKFPIPAHALSEQQKAAIELLLLGRALTETAEAIGIDRKTLYNWRRERAFVDELDARRDELWGDAAARLRAMVNPSLDILEQDLANRHERARFRAATAVLRLADLRRTLHRRPVSGS